MLEDASESNQHVYYVESDKQQASAAPMNRPKKTSWYSPGVNNNNIKLNKKQWTGTFTTATEGMMLYLHRSVSQNF
jgi:hypothetical protein